MKKAEVVVSLAEICLHVDNSNEAYIELQRVQAELKNVLVAKEQFWRQKARVKWLQHGDHNSRYFHSVIKQRRFQAAIHRIKDLNGNWIK